MKSDFRPLQRLFIFDRNEILVFFLLCVTFGLFTFTLGVHLGKEVGTKIEAIGVTDQKIVSTVPDQIPSNQELITPNKATQQAVDDALKQTLRDEVKSTNIRLNPVFQTELPTQAKSPNAGATTLKELKGVQNNTKHSESPSSSEEHVEH